MVCQPYSHTNTRTVTAACPASAESRGRCGRPDKGEALYHFPVGCGSSGLFGPENPAANIGHPAYLQTGLFDEPSRGSFGVALFNRRRKAIVQIGNQALQ